MRNFVQKKKNNWILPLLHLQLFFFICKFSSNLFDVFVIASTPALLVVWFAWPIFPIFVATLQMLIHGSHQFNRSSFFFLPLHSHNFAWLGKYPLDLSKWSSSNFRTKLSFVMPAELTTIDGGLLNFETILCTLFWRNIQFDEGIVSVQSVHGFFCSRYISICSHNNRIRLCWAVDKPIDQFRLQLKLSVRFSHSSSFSAWKNFFFFFFVRGAHQQPLSAALAHHPLFPLALAHFHDDSIDVFFFDSFSFI